MLYPVSNLNSASNFLKSSKLPLFKANSATSTKSLERTPDVDTLDKHKRKKSKRRVALLVGVYVALMSIQCVPLYKLYRKRQISIKEIEKKFEALQKNIPKVQKVFKDVFLKENLTEAQTVEILNRYKEIEKLRITATKEEYIEALFNEAKSNYGFAKADIPLMITPSESGKNILGEANVLNSYVLISPEASFSSIQNTVHHEMRHVKQHYMAANYDVEAFKKALRQYLDLKTARTMTEAEWDTAINSCMRQMRKRHNLRSFSRNHIPESQQEFAKKCLEEFKKPYIDSEKDTIGYFMQWREVDARFAGESIEKLFGVKLL